jgi:hypothetical protein
VTHPPYDKTFAGYHAKSGLTSWNVGHRSGSRCSSSTKIVRGADVGMPWPDHNDVPVDVGHLHQQHHVERSAEREVPARATPDPRCAQCACSTLTSTNAATGTRTWAGSTCPEAGDHAVPAQPVEARRPRPARCAPAASSFTEIRPSAAAAIYVIQGIA